MMRFYPHSFSLRYYDCLMAVVCCLSVCSLNFAAFAQEEPIIILSNTEDAPKNTKQPNKQAKEQIIEKAVEKAAEKVKKQPQKQPNTPQEAALSYPELRQQYQKQLDKCDLIHAQEVLSLNATPVGNIVEQADKWRDLLEKTKNKRLSCYQKAQETLEKTIATGLALLQENTQNTALAARLELDKQAADLLQIRTQINRQLLESMRADLESTLKAYKNTPEDEHPPSYVTESPTTTDLIRQDMSIVLELERRQLNLESRLIHNQNNNERALIKLKLETALHYLSRALMAYEDINRIKPARLLATLRSEYLYGAGQMHEIFALSPKLNHAPAHVRQNLLQLANRMQLMELDVEGALSDFRNGDLEAPLEDWLSEVYQDLSSLSASINQILQRFKNTNAPAMLNSGSDIEIPEDIAAFIAEKEQTHPNQPAQKKTQQKNPPKSKETIKRNKQNNAPTNNQAVTAE